MDIFFLLYMDSKLIKIVHSFKISLENAVEIQNDFMIFFEILLFDGLSIVLGCMKYLLLKYTMAVFIPFVFEMLFYRTI